MKPKKSLGFWILTSLVIGNMVGSGVFLLPASLASFGTISIFSWIFTSVGAVLIALVFVRLSTIMPKTGGPYAYCRAGLGDFSGFQIAFNYWVAIWVGNAAISNALTSYLAVIWPAIKYDHPLRYIIEVGVIWVLTLVNVCGVRQAGILQLITTILKLIPLILIAFVGIFFIHSTNLLTVNVTHHSNLYAFSGAATLTLWAFIGLEAASVPADNVIHPKRNIPLATITGTLVAAVIYILCTISIMGIIPIHQLASSASPFADAAQIIFGAWGKWLLDIGAVIACAGTLNGWILLQGQIPMAAAKDGLFPQFFAKESKNGTPANGLVFSSMLVSLLLLLTLNQSLVSQFTTIILLAVLASVIPYAYTAVSEIALFIKYPENFQKYHFTKSLILASLAFLYAAWAIIGAGETVVFYGALLFFFCIPLYPWILRTRPKKTTEI